jgi:hypothetical protein
MQLKAPRFGLPQWTGDAVMWGLSPLWAPFVGLLIAMVWIDEKLQPSGEWHQWFAWHPVRCDPWPDEGFRGVVWLETVWRANSLSQVKHRRNEPTAEEREAWARWHKF